jgi:hypothetical protein
VWEHAYYIDYRNMRPKFVETFLDKLVNWSFAEELRLSRRAVAMKSGSQGRRLPDPAGEFRARRFNGPNTVPRQLGAGLDGALGEPALVHFEHEAHRLGRAVRIASPAASCRPG